MSRPRRCTCCGAAVRWARAGEFPDDDRPPEVSADDVVLVHVIPSCDAFDAHEPLDFWHGFTTETEVAIA